MKVIEECEGYKKLLASVENDEAKSPNFHDYRKKFDWIISRAKHYAEKTGLDAADLLDEWEKLRNYWYMNYYQDANLPEIKGDYVRVFETPEDLHESIGKLGFRCPSCKGVSKSPYECDSGLEMSEGKICNWKSYGLFGTLGYGVYVFVKAAMRGENIFKPIAWESKES
jgi:hypothetical protein